MTATRLGDPAEAYRLAVEAQASEQLAAATLCVLARVASGLSPLPPPQAPRER